jgi:hypothetical protein
VAGSDTSEARHEVISALLQAEGPLTRRELAAQCRAGDALADMLEELRDDGLVAEGRWSGRVPQYRWAARWQEELRRQTAQAARELRARVEATGNVTADLFGEPARIFSEYVVEEYRPPADKRLLVFLQCSVGRPFGGTSSHGSMRHAITIATGHDAWREFEACPVHVVVLASEVGPVPYELQDVPPANISSLGVKQFGPERYTRARPVLAARLAAYLRAHGGNYDRIATFTQGRYGEVMNDVRRLTGREMAIFPEASGPAIVQMRGSPPRTYWQRYWIQLYLETVSWLSPRVQAAAAARLKALGVEWTQGRRRSRGSGIGDRVSGATE